MNGAGLQLVEHAIVSPATHSSASELLIWAAIEWSGSVADSSAQQEVEEIDRDLYRSKQLWKVSPTPPSLGCVVQEGQADVCADVPASGSTNSRAGAGESSEGERAEQLCGDPWEVA
jgi:hypothetical protein